jgi:anti-sigma factor RsiW
MGSLESNRPNPEWLAAYLDDELDQKTREKVEEWLAGDATARADLEGQRRLLKQWRETTPAEPAAAAWSALLANLEKAPRQLPKPWRFWNSPGWVAGILACTAAALWLALSLTSPRDVTPQGDDVSEAAPFAVATADEIEILSVEGADHPSVAVGEMPVRGPLELLAPGEMTVTSVQPDARDNMTPVVPQASDTPMFWAPLVAQK